MDAGLAEELEGQGVVLQRVGDIQRVFERIEPRVNFELHDCMGLHIRNEKVDEIFQVPFIRPFVKFFNNIWHALYIAEGTEQLSEIKREVSTRRSLCMQADLIDVLHTAEPPFPVVSLQRQRE